MLVCDVNYPGSRWLKDGSNWPNGSVQNLTISRYNTWLTRKPSIIVKVIHTAYNTAADKSNGRVYRQLDLHFDTAADRDQAYSVLNAMDPQKVQEKIRNCTLHLELSGEQRQPHTPFKPSANVTKQRKVQPS